MYEWKVHQTNDDNLEEELNNKTGEGWEIFSVVPTIMFTNKVMGVTIPGKIVHNLVLRKPI